LLVLLLDELELLVVVVVVEEAGLLSPPDFLPLPPQADIEAIKRTLNAILLSVWRVM
jgi:hypothetical protein